MPTLFIIGHVAIPYSGYIGPDTHPPRPWPTDAYYGDVNGAWTDAINVTGKTPGDGIFDQDTIPSVVELAVGRLDFALMPAFYNAPSPNARSETELIRQYLNKDHRYRHKQFSLPDLVISAAYFGDTWNNDTYGSTTANASGWFGLERRSIIDGDFFRAKKPSIWGFQGGFGSYLYSAINAQPPGYPDHFRSSTDLTNPTNEPPIAFYILSGSWFGEWNTSDNFLRATLGTPNYGLAASWNLFHAVRFERLGLGETLGEGLQHTQNEVGDLAFAVMGDPTLRSKVTAPVTSLAGSTNGSNVTLMWGPSPDAGAQYHVYRSTNGIGGTFTRLTSAPTTGYSYADLSAPAGQKTYQIRAMTFVFTGSGSYTNMSQGVITTVN